MYLRVAEVDIATEQVPSCCITEFDIIARKVRSCPFREVD